MLARTEILIEIQTVYDITFRWHMNDTPNQAYKTLFSVVSREIPVNFAFLLGQPWCDEAGALDNIAISVRALLRHEIVVSRVKGGGETMT